MDRTNRKEPRDVLPSNEGILRLKGNHHSFGIAGANVAEGIRGRDSLCRFLQEIWRRSLRISAPMRIYTTHATVVNLARALVNEIRIERTQHGCHGQGVVHR